MFKKKIVVFWVIFAMLFAFTVSGIADTTYASELEDNHLIVEAAVKPSTGGALKVLEKDGVMTLVMHQEIPFNCVE